MIDKVIHTVKTDIVKLVVEIESFGMSSDDFDKETGSFDGLQPNQVDLSCFHALNELYLHEIRVVPRTTLDIFQNIIFIPYFQYGVLVFWIRRIELYYLVVFGECRHGYVVSSLMDTAYWSSE
nr:hypothetical protein [Tanacetum cinerariifolium]